MNRQKVVLHEKEFYILYNAVSKQLIEKLKESGVSLKEGQVKTTIWSAPKDKEETYIRYFLKEMIDKTDINIAAKTEQKQALGVGISRHLYEQERHFHLAKVGVGIENWLLDVYAKFLGYTSYHEFRLSTSNSYAEKVNVIDTTISEFDQATDTVRLFYDLLSTKEFEGAWSLLSPNFQNRDAWKGEFKQFELGYNNFRGVKNCNVFNPSYRSNSVIECLVYYEDEIERHVINEIISIENMLIDDLDEFVHCINSINKKLSSLDGANIKKLPLQKLFDPTVSEFIWYTNKISPDKFREQFPMKKTIWVKRLYVCTCVKIGDKWLIDRIVQDKTYTST